MKKKVVAIGDSITWGFPYGEEASWVYFLSLTYPEIEWLNRGVNGDTFHGIFRRLEKDVLNLLPDYCIVMAGVNDVFLGYSLNEIQGFVERIRAKLQNHNITPILGNPIDGPAFTINRHIDPFREWLKKFTQDKGISLLNFGRLTESEFLDDAHPNRYGYAKMGEIAAVALKKILRE